MYIEYPFLKNRFIFDRISILDAEQNATIRAQLIATFFDYNIDKTAGDYYDALGVKIPHTHSLLLHIEEPRNGKLTSVIEALTTAEDKFDIVLHITDGGEDRIKEIFYKGCKLKSYKYRLDYSASETCSYPIWFSVENVIEKVLMIVPPNKPL